MNTLVNALLNTGTNNRLHPKAQIAIALCVLRMKIAKTGSAFGLQPTIVMPAGNC